MAEETAQTVRDEVAEWLAANWDPERPLLEWRSLLADSGWGCPTWPREWYGRGLPPALGGRRDRGVPGRARSAPASAPA